jgi:hypothetical protein
LRSRPGFIFRAFSKASAARASPSCRSGECSLLSFRIELARAQQGQFQAEIFGGVCPVADDSERKMQGYRDPSNAGRTTCRRSGDGAARSTLQKFLSPIGDLDLTHERVDAGVKKFGDFDAAILLGEFAWPLADITIGTALHRHLESISRCCLRVQRCYRTLQQCSVGRAREDSFGELCERQDY